MYDKHAPQHRHQTDKIIKYLEEAGSPLTADGLCQSSPAPEQMGRPVPAGGWVFT